MKNIRREIGEIIGKGLDVDEVVNEGGLFLIRRNIRGPIDNNLWLSIRNSIGRGIFDESNINKIR